MYLMMGSFKDKHLWVLKATGFGVTEFMLRMMAWLCTKDNQWRNCQMYSLSYNELLGRNYCENPMIRSMEYDGKTNLPLNF